MAGVDDTGEYQTPDGEPRCYVAIEATPDGAQGLYDTMLAAVDSACASRRR